MNDDEHLENKYTHNMVHRDKEDKRDKKDKKEHEGKKEKKDKKEKRDREEKKDKKEKKEKKDKKEMKEKKEKKDISSDEEEKGIDNRYRYRSRSRDKLDDNRDDDTNMRNQQQLIETYVEVINGMHYKVYKDQKRVIKYADNTTANPLMIEVIVNDRMGNKTRVKCCPTDTIKDLKRLVSAHTGTRYDKIRLQRWHSILKDHISLSDYEINHGSSIDMYYN